MNARVERHIDRLATRVMLFIVSTLKRAYNMRLVPESVERIRSELEDALREASIAGKLDALHPAERFGPDQSLIDTVPTGKLSKLPPKK